MNREESLKQQEAATFNTIPVTVEDGYEIIEQPDSIFGPDGEFCVLIYHPTTVFGGADNHYRAGRTV